MCRGVKVIFCRVCGCQKWVFEKKSKRIFCFFFLFRKWFLLSVIHKSCVLLKAFLYCFQTQLCKNQKECKLRINRNLGLFANMHFFVFCSVFGALVIFFCLFFFFFGGKKSPKRLFSCSSPKWPVFKSFSSSYSVVFPCFPSVFLSKFHLLGGGGCPSAPFFENIIFFDFFCLFWGLFLC